MSPATAFTLGTWSPPEAPLPIEYPLEVMDELRTAACEGFQRFSRGGLEIGGVLFGVRREKAIRILTWRPIACEHANGPTFVLSTKDRAGLARLIESGAADPDLSGLEPVGWFLSHTRSAICLSPSDQEIFSLFFPSGWQVTLVLQPDKMGTCRAGFFVRDSSGALRTDASYREFPIEPIYRPAPIAEPANHRQAEAPARPITGPVSALPKPITAPAAARPIQPVQPTPQIQFPPPATSKAPGVRLGWWVWVVGACLAMILGWWLFRKIAPPAAEQSFALRLLDRGGQLRLEWDKDSASVRKARGSSIEIIDDGSTNRYALTPDQLREGEFSYTRHSGDVSARMMLLLDNGSAVEEATRYIGPPVAPPAPAPEMLALQAERDRLKAEVDRLREELRKEKAKSRRSGRR